MRIVGGIVAGMVTAALVFWAIAFVGDLIFPLTTEIDARDPEQVTGAFASAPVGAKLMLLAALFGGAFAGGLVADRIALRRWAAWPPALLLTLFSLGTLFAVALPAWMQIALIVAPVAGALLAAHGVPRRTVVAGQGSADATL